MLTRFDRRFHVPSGNAAMFQPYDDYTKLSGWKKGARVLTVHLKTAIHLPNKGTKHMWVSQGDVEIRLVPERGFVMSRKDRQFCVPTGNVAMFELDPIHNSKGTKSDLS